MVGLNKYSDKEKRKMRMHNHIARDLRTPKYKQRRVGRKTRPDDYANWNQKDWLDFLTEEGY